MSWLWLNPKYWFMTKREREIAQAENIEDRYERDVALARLTTPPDQLESMLNDIDMSHGRISRYEWDLRRVELNETNTLARDRAILDIKLRHGKMSEYEFDLELVKLSTQDKSEQQIRTLHVDLKHKKVAQHEFDKRLADLEGRSWVNINQLKIDPDNPLIGDFELDWNAKFIDELREAGYLAPSDEQTVQLWFNELCKNIALEFYDGHGDFTERTAASPEEINRKIEFIKKYQDKDKK